MVDKNLHLKAVSLTFGRRHNTAMQKELVRNTNKKLIAGVVVGLGETYAPQMNLTLLRLLVALTVLFIHPISAVIVAAYLLLWYMMPTNERTYGLVR